jgi:hypothetical protein
MRRWLLAVWTILVLLCACLPGYAAMVTAD